MGQCDPAVEGGEAQWRLPWAERHDGFSTRAARRAWCERPVGPLYCRAFVMLTGVMVGGKAASVLGLGGAAVRTVVGMGGGRRGV